MEKEFNEINSKELLAILVQLEEYKKFLEDEIESTEVKKRERKAN